MRAKIARAEEHFQRLKQEFAVYVADYPGMILGHIEVARQADAVGFLTVYTLRALPPSVGVTIGDIVHCLRSSLDHLAWQVAKVPNSNTQFPIEDKPSNLDKRGRPAQPTVNSPTGPEVRALLASFQPWWPDGALNPKHPLRLLRELSNIDKHRQLPVALHNHVISWDDDDLLPPVGTKLTTRLRQVDTNEGSADFHLIPVGAHADLHVDLKLKWTLELRLRPLNSPTDEIIDFPIMPAIEVMIDAIRDDIAPALAEHIAR